MMSLLAILFPGVALASRAAVATAIVFKYVAMTIFVLLAVAFFFTPEILLITALVG